MGRWGKILLLGLIAIATGLGALRPDVSAQAAAERKVKSQVKPNYPPLARQMNVTGAVKVEVVIAPDGKVKSTRVIGGHPVLIDAVVEAVKQWKFEPATRETTQIVQFKFLRSESER